MNYPLPISTGRSSRDAYGRSVPVMAFLLPVSVAALLVADADMRHVLAPLLAVVNILVWIVMTLWDREGVLPVSEVGAICVLATAVYAVVPGINYIAGGLYFGPPSDLRLYIRQPTPREFAMFQWWYVAYLSSLAVVYALVRGRLPARREPVQLPDSTTRRTVLVLLVSLIGCFLLLEMFTGSKLNESYAEMWAGVADGTRVELPLFLRQISGKLRGWLFISKLALMVILVARWRQREWRYALFIWLGIEILLSVTRMGARTEAVLLILAAVVLYHRLVKPLSFRFCAISGSLLLAGFLVLGAARNGLIGKASTSSGVSLLAVGNEFQSLFATGYDLRCRVEEGLEVPWQVYFGDLFRPIPQQIFPGRKIDPGQWYLDVLGVRGQGQGCMFGVLGQAAVGFGIWELALRGALLGFILAKIHRWYVSKGSCSFFATLFYVWLCTRIYYTFRASTFYPVTEIIYEIIPVFVLIALPSAVKSCWRKAGFWDSSGRNLYVRYMRKDLLQG